MAYKYYKMVQLHIVIASVVLIGAMSSTVLAAHSDATSPPTTNILQFRDANFSVWNENVKYNSTAMSNPKGMEPLYNITTMILDFFLGKKPIPDGKCKRENKFRKHFSKQFIVCVCVCLKVWSECAQRIFIPNS